MAAAPTAPTSAIPFAAAATLAAPVNSAIVADALLVAVVIPLTADAVVETPMFGVGVASAATVFSSSGVVEYVITSPKNARPVLARGKCDTGLAPGKATRKAAGAEGFRSFREKFPGARTLQELELHLTLVEVVMDGRRLACR